MEKLTVLLLYRVKLAKDVSKIQEAVADEDVSLQYWVVFIQPSQQNLLIVFKSCSFWICLASLTSVFIFLLQHSRK